MSASNAADEDADVTVAGLQTDISGNIAAADDDFPDFRNDFLEDLASSSHNSEVADADLDDLSRVEDISLDDFLGISNRAFSEVDSFSEARSGDPAFNVLL